MSSFVNPSKTSIYFQIAVGELPQKLPAQSILTAPSGKGFNFESDFAQKTYQGTRFTANQTRITFNLQTRREAISRLRDMVGDGQTLFNIIVLESDTDDNPGFDNFTVGSIFRDCGLTGRSTSQNLADLTTIADPKQMDSVALSAGDWYEIRPLTISNNFYGLTGLPALFNFEYIIYDANVLTPQGNTEITVLTGYDIGTDAPLLAYSYSKGQGTWASMGVTGLPASLQIYEGVILNNRIIIGTSKGIYHASLTNNVDNPVWFLANGTTTSDSVTHMISPDPGLIIATRSNTSEYLYSYDGGFSFTRMLAGGGVFFSLAGLSSDLIWIGTDNAAVVRVRSQTRYDVINVAGLVGGEDIRTVAVPPGRPHELYVGTNTGRIFKSKNALARSPSWEELYYPKPGTASPSINLLKFSPDGSTLWIVFTVSGARLLVDYSGGHAGIACGQPFGSFSANDDLYVHSNIFALAVDDEYIVMIE